MSCTANLFAMLLQIRFDLSLLLCRHASAFQVVAALSSTSTDGSKQWHASYKTTPLGILHIPDIQYLYEELESKQCADWPPMDRDCSSVRLWNLRVSLSSDWALPPALTEGVYYPLPSAWRSLLSTGCSWYCCTVQTPQDESQKSTSHALQFQIPSEKLLCDSAPLLDSSGLSEKHSQAATSSGFGPCSTICSRSTVFSTTCSGTSKLVKSEWGSDTAAWKSCKLNGQNGSQSRHASLLTGCSCITLEIADQPGVWWKWDAAFFPISSTFIILDSASTRLWMHLHVEGFLSKSPYRKPSVLNLWELWPMPMFGNLSADQVLSGWPCVRWDDWRAHNGIDHRNLFQGAAKEGRQKELNHFCLVTLLTLLSLISSLFCQIPFNGLFLQRLLLIMQHTQTKIYSR